MAYTKKRELALEAAIKDLLDALERQCFPVASKPDQRCSYSLAVNIAIRRAQALLPADPKVDHKADECDLARPA